LAFNNFPFGSFAIPTFRRLDLHCIVIHCLAPTQSGIWKICNENMQLDREKNYRNRTQLFRTNSMLDRHLINQPTCRRFTHVDLAQF